MSKNVFLFSGQGSQYPGMGLELARRYPSSEEIFACAGDMLSLDLKKIFEESSAEELAQTKISQPAIFTVSLLALNAMKEEGVSFAAVAGHSLGEYAAMVAAGVVSLEDGYRLIGRRAAAMQDCAEQNPGSMYAVIGMSPEEIQEVCQNTEGYVVPVNYNSPVQTVIAGETQAAQRAADTFSQMGKRCMKLAVSAAFHSKLMQPAADRLLEEIRDIPFHAPQVDFYSNVTGQKLTDISRMPEYLASHLVSPVRFTSELELMSQEGYDHYVELGPNKVLTGLVKKTLKGVSVMNVENDKTLDKALETLKASL